MTVAVVVAVLLVLVVAMLWTFQRRLIFLPDTTPVPDAARLLDGAVDATLTTEDGLDLRALYLPPSADADGCRPTVLVAPGNAGNRLGRVPLAQALRDAGFGVLLLDYRGYGGNPGAPTEEGLAADARAAYAFLTGSAGLRPGELIYLGESLGAAVLTRLATEHPPAGLLLRSPFTELADVAQRQFPFLPVRLMLWDRFHVADLTAGLDVPTIVVYGTADTIVPPELSLTVAARSAGAERLVAVDGAGHNDPALVGGPDLIAAAVDLAKRAGCPPQG
jgi:pimeloyl-ACP methyl ester carboxylesterase